MWTSRKLRSVRLVLMAALACGALLAQTEEFTAPVIGISDGDTTRVLHGGVPERIRLWGIDCPEMKQAFGTRAKQFTGDLVFGQTVTLRVMDTDRYGRTVAEVILTDNRSLNRELVKAGMAWWYRRYAAGDGELERLEAEAHAARRGLWVDADPIPPWDFRKAKRAALSGRVVAQLEAEEAIFVVGRRFRHGYQSQPACHNGLAGCVCSTPAERVRAAGPVCWRSGRDRTLALNPRRHVARRDAYEHDQHRGASRE